MIHFNCSRVKLSLVLGRFFCVLIEMTTDIYKESDRGVKTHTQVEY